MPWVGGTRCSRRTCSHVSSIRIDGARGRGICWLCLASAACCAICCLADGIGCVPCACPSLRCCGKGLTFCSHHFPLSFLPFLLTLMGFARNLPTSRHLDAPPGLQMHATCIRSPRLSAFLRPLVRTLFLRLPSFVLTRRAQSRVVTTGR